MDGGPWDVGGGPQSFQDPDRWVSCRDVPNTSNMWAHQPDPGHHLYPGHHLEPGHHLDPGHHSEDHQLCAPYLEEQVTCYYSSGRSFLPTSCHHHARPCLTPVIMPIVHANPENIPIPRDWCSVSRCKMCDVDLNAPNQAKAHYEGKTHSKRVRQYFDAYKRQKSSGLTLDSLHLLQMTGESNGVASGPQEGEGDSKACALCNASFNSPTQAALHYRGKNHGKKARAKVKLVSKKQVGQSDPGQGGGERNNHISDRRKRRRRRRKKVNDVSSLAREVLTRRLTG